MLLLDENVSLRLVPRLEPLFPGTRCLERVAELGPATAWYWLLCSRVTPHFAPLKLAVRHNVSRANAAKVDLT